MRILLIAAGFAVGAVTALAGDPTPVAVLTSIENPVDVHVVRGPTTFAVSEGFGLQPGDVLRVGPKGSARIQYPDESTLTIAEGSEVRVEAATANVPAVTLSSGNIYAQIQHKAGSSGERHLKFLLRTKSIVMGVRGTQFVADESPAGETSLHTLEGKVEMAPDQKGLEEGRGVGVSESHMISAKNGVFSRVLSFNRKQFLEQHRQRFPAAHRVLAKFRQAFRERMQNRAQIRQNQKARAKAKAGQRRRKPQRDWNR